MNSAAAQASPSGLRRAAAPLGLICRLDPRTRILVAVLFSLVVAASNRPSTLGCALGAAMAALTVARVRPQDVIGRLVPINLLVLLLLLLLPWRFGPSWSGTIGPLHYSEGGLLLALTIALKANAIVLGMVALLGTLDAVTAGHALGHLGVPEKLTHLLLFTVRYLDVLQSESLRLRTSMKLRGFRPRVNAHTFRSYGYLVGMLLVRSLDRSDRVLAAMKCRGFRGQFYLLDHFAFSRRDVGFSALAVLILVTLVLLELR